MRSAVVDASVAVKWFRREAKTHHEAALTIRRDFEAGDLHLAAPHLLLLEVLNVFGRRWQWRAQPLLNLAVELDDLAFDLIPPETQRIAPWISRGLSAYDGAYVAVAEQLGVPLVTTDERVIAASDGIAVHLAAFAA